MRTAQPSSGKAMAPAKATAHHRARCTILPSRLQKPMPPNGRWRPSASRSVSSSTGAARPHHPKSPCPHRHPVPVAADAHVGFHPDDTTPIPRPSRYYGRRQDMVTRDRATQGRRELEVRPSPARRLSPASPGLVPAQIDKSVLAIAEPKRLRDKAHLRFVASQPCLVCGRQPSDPHHLRFAQPRALGLKVSDEFTVPLCRGHHRQLHQAGNEVAWWEDLKIKPWRSPRRYGSRRIQKRRSVPMLRPFPTAPKRPTAAGTATDDASTAPLRRTTKRSQFPVDPQ